MRMHKSITVDRLMDAVERRSQYLDNPGFCRECGAEVDGVEPDARNYHCEVCDGNSVFGAEELLFEVY